MPEMLDIALASCESSLMAGYPDSTVSQFWLTKYGIENYGQFREIVDKVLSGPLPFGNLGFNDIYAVSAWTQPELPAGLAVQLYLRRAGYTGSAGTAYQDAVDTATTGSIQAVGGTLMSTLVIPNCFQVSIQADVDGRAVDNVIGVYNPSGTAGDAAGAVETAWETGGGPLANMPDAYVVKQYVAVDLSSPDGQIYYQGSIATGEDSTHPIATRGAAALIQWNGSSRSRSTRGRMYLGPLTTAQINPDGATLTTVAHGALENSIQNFLDSLTSSGYPLAVLSRKNSSSTLVSAHAVETTIATQRRRIRA